MSKTPLNTYLRRFLFIGFFALMVIMFMDFNNRITTLFHKNRQRNEIRGEVYQLELTRYHLETQIAYATSELAVKEWARLRKHLTRPSDIPIYVLPEQDSNLTQVIEPTPIPISIDKWEIWQMLFFDD